MHRIHCALLFLSILILFTFTCCSSAKMVQDVNKVDNATIIILAYPHELVATTPSLYSYGLPVIGMGNGKYIRAGHSAMVLVKDGSDTFEYFDLGRYVTPRGYSRARSVLTDPDVKVEVTPRWEGTRLTNVEELLQWLGKHPHKTRGDGLLYASVCEGANYENVKTYVAAMQNQGLVAYGPFEPNGSNCARFVGNALRCGIVSEEVLDRIEEHFNIAPSVLGLVDAGNSYDHHYEITEDTLYTSTRDLMEVQKACLFDWGKDGYTTKDAVHGSQQPHLDVEAGDDWRWLLGTGCGAWFHIEKTDHPLQYIISKYDERGRHIFRSLFSSSVEVDVESNFTMDYLSDYRQINILLECGTRVSFERIAEAERYILD